MTYEQALEEANKAGASKVTGLPYIAMTLKAICIVHVGINPKMAYNGAVKKGLTEKQFKKMLKNVMDIGDLMFV